MTTRIYWGKGEGRKKKGFKLKLQDFAWENVFNLNKRPRERKRGRGKEESERSLGRLKGKKGRYQSEKRKCVGNRNSMEQEYSI